MSISYAGCVIQLNYGRFRDPKRTMERGETGIVRSNSRTPQLKLTANLSEVAQRSSVTLVGKIISENELQKNTVQLIIRKIWFTQDPVGVEQLSTNLFLFSFKRMSDRNRIWFSGRRSMEPKLFLKNGAQMNLKDFNFSCATFQVQIHGLPLQFINKENALKIGSLFKGVVSCQDSSKSSVLGMKFMRIQVEVDIIKPIPTACFQQCEKGKFWIQLCYERLGDLCYAVF